MNEKTWWFVSFAVAFIFGGVVGIQWDIEDSAFNPN
jgi:hypothetical protein